MTEAEWLAATDPMPMLMFVHDSGKGSRRKFWLFTAACCERASRFLPSELTGAMARVSEVLASGEASPEERDAACVLTRRWKETFVAWHEFDTAYSIRDFPKFLERPAQRAFNSARLAIRLTSLFDWSGCEIGSVGMRAEESVSPREQPPEVVSEYYRGLSSIARCVFSYSTSNLDPAWLAWNSAAVPRIARSICDDRAFDHMALLADALEDAGCTDAGLLSHLRGPGPHVRGCRGLDLVLEIR
jgi:hypothetical protein